MSEIEAANQKIEGISQSCLHVRLSPDSTKIFSPHDKALFLKVAGKMFLPASLENLYHLAECCEKEKCNLEMKDGDEQKLT